MLKIRRQITVMFFAAAMIINSIMAFAITAEAVSTEIPGTTNSPESSDNPYATGEPKTSEEPYATNTPESSAVPYEQDTPAPLKQDDTNIPDKMKESLPAVNITNIVPVTKTSVKINWEKIPEADGYYIYRILDFGKLKKLKKIKNNTTTVFTDNGLTYGQTYKYVVRAYKEYNGKIYLGSYNKEGYAKKLKVKSVYKKGYKYYYDMDGNRIDDVLPFTGKKKSYLIKVNIQKNVTTIYAKDGKKGYTIPVKVFLCSGNKHDTLGTYSLGTRYRYRTLFYNTYGQWTVRIHDSILFHTVVYKKSHDPDSLDVKEYNKLGTSASHGCIRLQCSGMKWIYDNCKAGTKVIFYKSSNPGPLGKPKLEKLPKWHTWDPTDPNMQYKCAEKKCNHKGSRKTALSSVY